MKWSGFLHFLFTGEPFSPQEIHDVKTEVSFKEAIAAHLAWKKSLVHALAGTGGGFDLNEAGDDCACVLGRWIHGPGHSRYGDLSSFMELREHHARFHQLAHEIVVLRRSNESPAARQLMDGEFKSVSHSIVERLEHMSELFGS